MGYAMNNAELISLFVALSILVTANVCLGRRWY